MIMMMREEGIRTELQIGHHFFQALWNRVLHCFGGMALGLVGIDSSITLDTAGTIKVAKFARR
jgi:hypothetical protein